MDGKLTAAVPVTAARWTRWMENADRIARVSDGAAMARLDDDGAPAADEVDGEAPTGRYVGVGDDAGRALRRDQAWAGVPDPRRSQLHDLMTRLDDAVVRLRPEAGQEEPAAGATARPGRDPITDP